MSQLHRDVQTRRPTAETHTLLWSGLADLHRTRLQLHSIARRCTLVDSAAFPRAIPSVCLSVRDKSEHCENGDWATMGPPGFSGINLQPPTTTYSPNWGLTTPMRAWPRSHLLVVRCWVWECEIWCVCLLIQKLLWGRRGSVGSEEAANIIRTRRSTAAYVCSFHWNESLFVLMFGLYTQRYHNAMTFKTESFSTLLSWPCPLS